MSFARGRCCDKKDRTTVITPLLGWCVACASRMALWDEEEATAGDEVEAEYARSRSHSSDVFEF